MSEELPNTSKLEREQLGGHRIYCSSLPPEPAECDCGLNATRPAPKADGLAEELERLAEGKHWHHTADHFQSEVEPGRWYVSDGHTGRFATEIGATSERDAELVALLLRNLPAILAALKDRDVVLEEAARAVATYCRNQNSAKKPSSFVDAVRAIRALKERV